MATLEKREQTPGKISYRVRWWADGKQRSKSFKAFDEARRWKAVLEGDLVTGSYIDPKAGCITLSEFSERALESITIDVRASTRERIVSAYKTHLAPEFGTLPLTAITGAVVNDWLRKVHGQRSPATIRKNAHVLRRLLDQAVAEGLIKANPARSVRLPAEPKNEQRFLSQSEALTLADCIHPRFRAMVLVAVFGGLRFGEITALRLRHVDSLANTVKVQQTAVEIGSTITYGPPKTRTSVRTVTLPRSVMSALVKHIEAYCTHEPDALVFTGQRGNAITRNNWYRHYWKPATTQAGHEGLRFHDLRHTFVALWVHLGRNPKQVSKAAGHSSVAFTLDRYGHLYDTDDTGLADELDGLLGLTRTHDMASEASSSLCSVRPPSYSGRVPRPFTGNPASQPDS